jgi:hypothetical protein
MTVEELRKMNFDEYQNWLRYFDQRPIGWREDLRTYYIMSSFAEIKKKPDEIFPSLIPIFAKRSDRSAGDSLKGTMMHDLMLKAKGGKMIS